MVACSLPESLTALRSELIRLLTVASDTNRPLPDRVDELVLADHALPVLDQEYEQIEDLRLHGDRVPVACQFQLVRVHTEGSETIDHRLSRS